jgi:hypothetical protein
MAVSKRKRSQQGSAASRGPDQLFPDGSYTFTTESADQRGRWMRWRLSAPGATATWDATFRVRIGRSRSSFFAPTQLQGCVLWLRSDLGIPSQTTTGMAPGAKWTDQSPIGNSGTVVGGNGLTYAAGTRGIPSISPSSGSYVTGTFSTSLFDAQASHTHFNVSSYPFAGTQGVFATVDTAGDASSGFAQLTHNVPSASGRVGNSGGTSFIDATTTTGLPAANTPTIYSTAGAGMGSNVDIWINGKSKASTAVTVTPSITLDTFFIFCLSLSAGAPQFSFTGAAYEFLIFNRILSAAERLVVHRYLGGRYGIAVP